MVMIAWLLPPRANTQQIEPTSNQSLQTDTPVFRGVPILWGAVTSQVGFLLGLWRHEQMKRYIQVGYLQVLISQVYF